MKLFSLILVHAILATSPAFAQPLPPVHISHPIPAPSPYPAGAAMYQWDYECAAQYGEGCGLTTTSGIGSVRADAGAADRVKQFTTVQAIVPMGDQKVPAYFYWYSFTIANDLPNTIRAASGFVHNPPAFLVSVFGNMRLVGAIPLASNTKEK